MNIDIDALRAQYPALTFGLVETGYVPRCEDAVYVGAPPPGETLQGAFVQITNPMGGSDTIAVSDSERILRLAAWHQARAVARGY